MATRTATEEQIALHIHALIDAGWTQTAIGESLGVTPSVVSLLKHGEYKSNLEGHLESLRKLAEDEQVEVTTDAKAKEAVKSDPSYADWLSEQLGLLHVSPAQLAKEASLSTQAINLILDGSTSNPQAGTRAKIQKAFAVLGQAPAVSNAPKMTQADRREVFTGILFTEDEIAQVPNKKGVYVVHDRRGYPTYVGKGDVRSRLNAHREHVAFLDKRVAYTFSYVILEVGEGKDARDAANREALWLENLVAKFAGNTVLLNKRLLTDLSDSAMDEEQDT